MKGTKIDSSVKFLSIHCFLIRYKQIMEEKVVHNVGLQNACCSGSLAAYFSRFNGMVSRKNTYINGSKDLEVPLIFVLVVQIRLLLQLLLTALFIVYFGLPSVERFLMKRVISVYNLMHITSFKGDGSRRKD